MDNEFPPSSTVFLQLYGSHGHRVITTMSVSTTFLSFHELSRALTSVVDAPESHLTGLG